MQISGCEKSGLFQAFSDHVLHRLQIPLHRKEYSQIRITILSRQTKFRNILNVNELVQEIRQNTSYNVRVVSFERYYYLLDLKFNDFGTINFGRNTKFREQLEITRNTDVFIGMHGAGLTHLLFLPKWATIFELYHCEDPACYKDLARIRGINYITWQHKAKLEQQDEVRLQDLLFVFEIVLNFFFCFLIL